jgi:hypothetical protein
MFTLDTPTGTVNVPDALKVSVPPGTMLLPPKRTTLVVPIAMA